MNTEEQRKHDETHSHSQAMNYIGEEPKKRTPLAFWLFLAALVLAPMTVWYFKHRA